MEEVFKLQIKCEEGTATAELTRTQVQGLITSMVSWLSGPVVPQDPPHAPL